MCITVLKMKQLGTHRIICYLGERLGFLWMYNLGLHRKVKVEHHQYAEGVKKDLQHAYQLAVGNSLKTQQRNKRLYDRRVKHQILEKGDRVLIKNLALTGKHKLVDRWNSLPYVVQEKLPNLPVYRLKPETGTGGIRTLHRDHLLPIGEGVRVNLPDPRSEVPEKRVTRSKAEEETPDERQRQERKRS